MKRKPRFLYLLAIAVVAGSLALAYELGRFNGGYSYLDQRRERDELNAVIAERDRMIEDLQRSVAILETSQEVDRETYSQVERNLSELQARIQSQEEELAFYRGIISPEDGVAGLRVQSLEIRPADSGHGFFLHLVLVQAITHDRRVSGTVSVSVSGMMGDEPVQLGLDELAADHSGGELAYSFRYFQDLQRELELPDGFAPDEVVMEIRPREPGGDVLRRTFEWATTAG